MSNFNWQPKIHKSKEIKIAVEIQKSEYIEIPEPSDYKFKPIVGGPTSPHKQTQQTNRHFTTTISLQDITLYQR